jgi:hypothetical protein
MKQTMGKDFLHFPFMFLIIVPHVSHMWCASHSLVVMVTTVAAVCVCELPAEAEGTVECQGWLPWLRGVTCVRNMVRQEKHLSIEHLVHRGRARWQHCDKNV